MLTDIEPKQIPKFCCETCDFKCYKKGDYKRHIVTAKHKKLTEMQLSLSKHKCEECNKQYKSRVGLWSHKKKHHLSQKISMTTPNEASSIDTQAILMLIKQNQEFKEMLLEQQNKMMISQSNVNSNNNST